MWGEKLAYNKLVIYPQFMYLWDREDKRHQDDDIRVPPLEWFNDQGVLTALNLSYRFDLFLIESILLYQVFAKVHDTFEDNGCIW